MFCPKCGNQLPDEATFCNKCGNQLQSKRPEAQATAPASAKASVAIPKAPSVSMGGFTPVGILARIAAVVAIVAMFMPWLEIPGMQSIAKNVAYLGINMSGDYAYPMYDMSEVTKTLDTLSSSSAYTAIQMAFFALWVVALVLLVIGLVRSFIGNKSTGALLPGGIVAAIVAIAWFGAISYLDADYARQLAQLIGNRVQFFVIPGAVWVTFVAGLASGILGVMGKQKA